MNTKTFNWHETALKHRREFREELHSEVSKAREMDAESAQIAVNDGMPKAQVARLLGISRPTLYALLEDVR